MRTLIARALAPLVAALLALPVQAASPPPVRTAPRETPVAVSAAQGAQLIKIAKLFVESPGKRVGTIRDSYFCRVVSEFRLNERISEYVLAHLRDALQKELAAAGYPRVQASAFEQESADANVEYQLGLNLTDAQLELCSNDNKVEGGVWLQAEIELYAARERKVMYRGAFQGHAQSASGQWVAEEELFSGAARQLVRNLLADAGFVRQATRRAESSSNKEGPDSLRILKRKASAKAGALALPQLQSSLATIFSGAGSGSGFLVGAEGYWLTNRHVVGDAKFVKLRLPTGREMLGEVLRSDARRDVALVKTEPVTLLPFELRGDEPATGDDVFALGSPLGEKFEGTVTRGVVSSFREVEQQRYLQSDVKILPGSSGGPLVDARGGVVGMASSGVAGIHLFVPIREAIAVLKLEFQ